MEKRNCKEEDIGIESIELVEENIIIIFVCENHDATFRYSEFLSDLIENVGEDSISISYLLKKHLENKTNW